MDRIEFHFDDPSTGEVANRQYEVEEFDEAYNKFHEEFPDESTRPHVFRVKVEHVKA